MLYRRKLKNESNSDSEKDNSSKNLDQNENGEKFDHRFQIIYTNIQFFLTHP